MPAPGIDRGTAVEAFHDRIHRLANAKKIKRRIAGGGKPADPGGIGQKRLHINAADLDIAAHRQAAAVIGHKLPGDNAAIAG